MHPNPVLVSDLDVHHNTVQGTSLKGFFKIKAQPLDAPAPDLEFCSISPLYLWP